MQGRHSANLRMLHISGLTRREELKVTEGSEKKGKGVKKKRRRKREKVNRVTPKRGFRTVEAIIL